MHRILPILVLLSGCDPYQAWPDPHDVYPWVYTPETDLEDWENTRWEEGPWDTETEPTKNADYLTKAVLHRTGAPLETAQHFGLMRSRMPAVVPDHLVINFVGDTMYTGDPSADYSPVSHLLDGHLRVGNLETLASPGQVAGTGGPGGFSYNAPVSMLDDLPLDLVQLNNNHSLDLGDEGLEATVAELSERGIGVVGVDQHLLVNFGDGVVVAFLSYTWGINESAEDSAHELYVIPFGEAGPVDLSRVGDDAAAARDAGAALIVVLTHWGFEYEYFPTPEFLQMGRGLVAEGADLVVGAGPHVAQPAEWCTVNIPAAAPDLGRCSLRTDDGTPRYAGILYSLGNFGTLQPTVPLQVGLIADVSMWPGIGVTGMQWTPVATVEGADRYVLQPLSELLDTADYEAENARLNQHIGARWRRVE